MKELEKLNFNLVGIITNNGYWDEEHPKVRFNLTEEFNKSQDKNLTSWVYAWVSVKDSQYTILYIGKAGKTLRQRFSGHEGGSKPGSAGSSKGRKNSKNLKSLIDQGVLIEIWARKSEMTELFGESISLVSTEEEALIKKFKKQYSLWNKN